MKLFDHPKQPMFDPLTDQATLDSLQLYLVALVDKLKTDQNGHGQNIVRAFRDIVAETTSSLNS
jgi:hypothetical protein